MAEVRKHFTGRWQHRDDDNVLYLVYEHMHADLPGTVRRVADFIDIELDDELLALTCEHASLAFMQTHKDRFDDAMLRAHSESTVLPTGSDSAKVRAGKVGVNSLSDATVQAVENKWRELVTPETGFECYEDLIAWLTI